MSWHEFKLTHQWNGDHVEHRPVIAVQVTGSCGSLTVFGLVDSGCETTMISKDIADVIGIDLNACKTCRIGGVGGTGGIGYLSQVTLTFEKLDTSFESPVIFADMPIQMLLGQHNFFAHFKVLFERDKGTFKLNKIHKQ